MKWDCMSFFFYLSKSLSFSPSRTNPASMKEKVFLLTVEQTWQGWLLLFAVIHVFPWPALWKNKTPFLMSLVWKVQTNNNTNTCNDCIDCNHMTRCTAMLRDALITVGFLEVAWKMFHPKINILSLFIHACTVQTHIGFNLIFEPNMSLLKTSDAGPVKWCFYNFL